MTKSVVATIAPKWLSRKAAAAAYAIGLTTLDELIAAGKVTAKKTGERTDGRARRVLVSVASLDAWAESLDEA